ncbi:MAG: hypothetical protein ACRDA4_10550 [Filifactoraceae bacterium]
MFYDKVINRIKKTPIKELGRLVVINTKDTNNIYVDIQPITEQAKKYEFGQDIQGTKQMFSDEGFSVDDIILYKNKTYRIEKKIEWDDYYNYSLLEVDIKWQ